MTRAGYVVAGRVQGVGFRWWTQRLARELGIAGTVRNCADGTVEVFAAGTPGDMKRFRESLGKGPPFARVDSIFEIPHQLASDVRGFSIL